MSVGTKSEEIICGELQIQEHLKIKLYGQERLEAKRAAGYDTGALLILKIKKKR